MKKCMTTSLRRKKINAVKPFFTKKLEKGLFKGKTLICETGGVTRTVICKKCGFKFDVTFFLKNYKVSDAGSCPECSNKILTFA